MEMGKLKLEEVSPEGREHGLKRGICLHCRDLGPRTSDLCCTEKPTPRGTYKTVVISKENPIPIEPTKISMTRIEVEGRLEHPSANIKLNLKNYMLVTSSVASTF